MHSRTALVALLGAGLAGCTEPRPPALDYLPPSGAPAVPRSAVVEQQPWLVWGNIIDHLEQRGLPVTALDEAAGELTVDYRGDPEPYVDCGWIVTYKRDDLERLPAASAEASFPRRRQGDLVDFERDLRLEARMTVRVEPDDEAAIVRTESVYVLTKTVAAEDAAEPPQVLHAETISFPTGEAGTFSSGTTCQANGELERLVLDALPAVSFAGS
ncbi:MAG: hypothetical protein K0S96_2315 [Geminicoccaceae bacterium]|nr:hypothetical protein [Geminicoccaceae bacterium]